MLRLYDDSECRATGRPPFLYEVSCYEEDKG
jgi:hypothetical protein